MNAPKEIVMRLKRAPTKDGAAFIPYIERKDGNLFRQPIPSTKYTRSDIVAAVVNDVLKPLNQMDSLFQGILVADETNNAVTVRVTDLRALSTALKALGE